MTFRRRVLWFVFDEAHGAMRLLNAAGDPFKRTIATRTHRGVWGETW